MTATSIKKRIFSNFKGDLFGGITAGVIALPLALAFGVASGVGAAAGLYGAIIVGMLASIFGGTKSQVSGPTGPMTVVLASIFAMHPGNLKIIFLTILLAGVFQILLGILKLGDLIKYVPYPVISGFMSGIGVIIIILQLNPILGLTVQGSTLSSLIQMFSSLNQVDFQTILVGAMTLVVVFFTPQKIAKNVPPSLIALVLVTVVAVVFKFDVQTIGSIPTALPKLNIPIVPFDVFVKIIPTALTLAILGTVDSLLTSLVADSLTKTRHKPNQELIGQGLGNMAAGLFGGIAGAGATMRTVVNIKSGGKTRLSGVIHSLFLLTILLGAAPLAAYIPMAVLAGILIKVGFDIIDYKFINVIKFAPKRDLAVMLLVFFITVFYDLIFAVGAGIVLSSVLFAASVSQRFNVTVNGLESDGCTESQIPCSVEDSSQYKIRVIDVEGVFFFGSVSQILNRVDDILGTRYAILNCQSIDYMDISAVFALEDIICRLKDKDTEVLLVLNNEALKNKLSNLGILNILDEENIFYDKQVAVDKARELINIK